MAAPFTFRGVGGTKGGSGCGAVLFPSGNGGGGDDDAAVASSTLPLVLPPLPPSFATITDINMRRLPLLLLGLVLLARRCLTPHRCNEEPQHCCLLCGTCALPGWLQPSTTTCPPPQAEPLSGRSSAHMQLRVMLDRCILRLSLRLSHGAATSLATVRSLSTAATVVFACCLFFVLVMQVSSGGDTHACIQVGSVQARRPPGGGSCFCFRAPFFLRLR